MTWRPGSATRTRRPLASGSVRAAGSRYTVTVPNSGQPDRVSAHRFQADDSRSGLRRRRARLQRLGTAAGLAIKGGVIFGQPTRTGSFSVTVTAHDDDANGGQVAFKLQVIKPPPRFTAVKLTGVGQRRPQLRFSVTKGRISPALRSVTVRLPPGLSFARDRSGRAGDVGRCGRSLLGHTAAAAR